jgi:hypothetical protein
MTATWQRLPQFLMWVAPLKAFRISTARPIRFLHHSGYLLQNSRVRRQGGLEGFLRGAAGFQEVQEFLPEPGFQTAPSTKREKTPRPKPTTEARTVFTRDLPESELRMENRWCGKGREGKSSGGYPPFRPPRRVWITRAPCGAGVADSICSDGGGTPGWCPGWCPEERASGSIRKDRPTSPWAPWNRTMAPSRGSPVSQFRSCPRTSCASIWRGRSRLSASGMRSLGDIDRLRLCTGDR